VPPGAAKGQNGPWATDGHGPKQLFSVIFTEHSFIVFVQFFEQISHSFLYSNYSNEKFV
jgi:hypothetical protein